MHSNEKTLASYNHHIQECIDGTSHEASGDVKRWLDRAFENTPKDATILELGSAFGRDALYLQSQGYTVTSTDATPAFVDLLNSKQTEAYELNALTDEFPVNLDAVLANAVLLHFNREEAEQVIQKTYAALAAGGMFAFSLKRGAGEEWSEEKLGAPRYFCYWNENEIGALLESAGFADVEIVTDETSKWLHIIAYKPSDILST